MTSIQNKGLERTLRKEFIKKYIKKKKEALQQRESQVLRECLIIGGIGLAIAYTIVGFNMLNNYLMQNLQIKDYILEYFKN